jgi:hypothetical protein
VKELEKDGYIRYLNPSAEIDENRYLMKSTANLKY